MDGRVGRREGGGRGPHEPVTPMSRGGRFSIPDATRPSVAGHVIGLIADTHGLLRPDVYTALAGVELILHAGDVGGGDVLDELALIAPTLAVRGNTDPPDDPRLADEIVRAIAGLTVHVSHGHELGVPTPAELLAHYPQSVLVYGHTHRPLIERAAARLVVNPGAAGPRRFRLSPSVARLTVRDAVATAEIVKLGD
jgi:uncharacterized protein